MVAGKGTNQVHRLTGWATCLKTAAETVHDETLNCPVFCEIEVDAQLGGAGADSSRRFCALRCQHGRDTRFEDARLLPGDGIQADPQICLMVEIHWRDYRQNWSDNVGRIQP